MLFANIQPHRFEFRGQMYDSKEIDGLLFYQRMQEYVALIDALETLPDTVVALRPDFQEHIKQLEPSERYVS
ncbi:hypothetical protein HN419_06165 [Candidatus Woesearchaeota archaeon]|jgi:hypothetical protein|nr:hypothetical protein [Candidatus Woesearchaeota archaeon]MBT3538081.1 hypothetical protein [Candidatus Woesearchaeota archaeon]MBT7105750.1 hypothetical protein [Candidatus Woesearchaeota archaeon]MBT7930755.1 hypothetical protein [Candidatus Woesearchaeota archaeon]